MITESSPKGEYTENEKLNNSANETKCLANSYYLQTLYVKWPLNSIIRIVFVKAISKLIIQYPWIIRMSFTIQKTLEPNYLDFKSQ